MNFNSLHWFDLSVFIAISFSVVLNVAIIHFWNYERLTRLGLERYKAKQRIHTKETPRMGGFIMLASLWLYGIFSHETDLSKMIFLVLGTFTPAFVVTFKEDIFYNVGPFIRLLGLLVSAFLFAIFYQGTWPTIEIPYLSIILNYWLVALIFYPLAIAAISNGMNLIDGVNGLCASAALAIMGCLLFLAHQTNDTLLLLVTFSLILVTAVFLLFNYPSGRIFLGDSGAYFLGFSLAILTILFFARHPELPTINAILILIYPATELIFSLSRRLLAKRSPYHADTEHLHMKLFLIFRPNSIFKKIANALVMPVMFFLWAFPLITLPWVYQKPFFIIVSILIFIFSYVYLYFKIPNKI
jgi:UDP-N-acetylmuramyl pentapeptide phosphotransferase/UDP-N-acetylglucosamine-1-phosphate transferase